MKSVSHRSSHRMKPRSQARAPSFSQIHAFATASRQVKIGKSVNTGPHVDAAEVATPSVAFYRRRTEAMLRRYLRVSLEVGRMPSCLPKEMMRARRTRQKGCGLEDLMIFVYDVEKCMAKLSRSAVDVLTRVALQEYSQREAAHLMGMSQSSLGRCYDDALDCLSYIFLTHELLPQ